VLLVDCSLFFVSHQSRFIFVAVDYACLSRIIRARTFLAHGSGAQLTVPTISGGVSGAQKVGALCGQGKCSQEAGGGAKLEV